MSNVIVSKEVKARKQHRCDWCGCKIQPQTLYTRSFIKGDDVYTWKNHLHCLEIAQKLKMFDECDEGVTEDDFYEYIQQEFNNLFGDEKYFTDQYKKFEQRLKAVCDHHKIQYV